MLIQRTAQRETPPMLAGSLNHLPERFLGPCARVMNSLAYDCSSTIVWHECGIWAVGSVRCGMRKALILLSFFAASNLAQIFVIRFCRIRTGLGL